MKTKKAKKYPWTSLAEFETFGEVVAAAKNPEYAAGLRQLAIEIYTKGPNAKAATVKVNRLFKDGPKALAALKKKPKPVQKAAAIADSSSSSSCYYRTQITNSVLLAYMLYQ